MSEQERTRAMDPADGNHGQGARRVEGGDWTIDPMMIAAVLTGIYLLVTGLVAIARAGFAELTPFEPVVVVGGLPHTPLLGVIEIILGLLVLYAGAVSGSGSTMTFLGGLFLVLGLVWFIEPGAFQQYLGVDTANGVQHIVLGLVLGIAGQITPIVIRR